LTAASSSATTRRGRPSYPRVAELGLLLQEVAAGGLGGLELQGQMHAFMAAVLLGWPGLMRSISMLQVG
jgi:hypothetical protein